MALKERQQVQQRDEGALGALGLTLHMGEEKDECGVVVSASEHVLELLRALGLCHSFFHSKSPHFL